MQIDRPIAIAVILFIILLLVFFLVMPEYETFKQLRVELGEKKAEFNAEFEYYAATTKAYEDLQTKKDDIKKIDDALPQATDLGRIVYFLQKTAIASGMILKDLSLAKSALSSGGEAKSVKEVAFSVNLMGSYSSLQNFMIAIEKSARLFEITNISFGSVSRLYASPPQSVPTQFEKIYDFSLQIKTNSY